MLAGCGGEDAGLTGREARRAVHDRVMQRLPTDTDFYGEAARKATAPGGEEAWLVRVLYAGGSTCMYIWRKVDKNHMEPDRGCGHWESD